MFTVDYLIVADAAAALQGKHYIHGGGWEVLYAAIFPVRHRSMSVAIRLRIPWTDTNRAHNLEIDVVDADGHTIVPNPPGPFRAPITVGRPPFLEFGSDQTACLAMNLFDIEFQHPGSYVVVLRIDGEDAARSPFRIALMPAIPGMPGMPGMPPQAPPPPSEPPAEG